MNPFIQDQEFTPHSIASKYCTCDPVSLTATSVLIAGAGAGASIAGQTERQKAARTVEQQKQDAVAKQIETNRVRATEDYIASVTDERTQQDQEHQALTEQELDIAKKGRDATSQARVAAAESGVAGQSLAIIEQDYQMQMEVAKGRLKTNQQWADANHERRIDAYGRQYTNRVSSVQPYAQQAVPVVDYFGPIFGIAQTGLDTYTRTDGWRTNPLK